MRRKQKAAPFEVRTTFFFLIPVVWKGVSVGITALFLALKDKHCIGAHTASPEESARIPWAGCHVSSVCLSQQMRKDPVGHP